MSGQTSPQSRSPQVCIVEASAGSGKTYALAQRYLKLLINPALNPGEAPLKNILAITFSNKATMEMKARILDFLKKIALDRFSDAEEKQRIIAGMGVSFPEAQKRALSAMEELIINYNFFQVQTIDSFVNAILSACALKLGLSAGFRIRTDSAVYLAYGLDILIDTAAGDKAVCAAFSSFLHQYLFLENRTSWFPKDNILDIIVGLLAKMNRIGLPFNPSRIDAKTLIKGKKEVLGLMRQLKSDWPEGAHKSFQKSFEGFLDEHKEGFDFGDLSDFWAREAFPLTKSGKISITAEKLWSKIREALGLLADAESALLMDPYLDIFSKTFGHFRALAVRDDALFLDELNRQTRLLFDEGGLTVPELYYRLAMRLKHILIDEFQDTSPLQWDNLYPMIEEVLSTDGSLFCVGDKKQAIYRFRGGDATLFDTVKERFRGTNLTLEYLRQNYRSLKEIVAFTNDIFSESHLKLFLQKCRELKKEELHFTQKDEEVILKVFQGSQQNALENKGIGYVRLESISAGNKEECNAAIKEKLLALIAELSGRFSFSAIALLVRENEDVELLTEWLVEKGIRVASEKTLNIRNNALIKELVSFLKFLNTPIDDLFFASFICGDIFLKASRLSRDEVHDFIFSTRQKRNKEKNVYLYREFRRRYPKVWEEYFEEFFKNVGFVPLYELAIAILLKFDCPAAFADSQGFFMRFLELIKEQEEEKNSLSLFLEFFDAAAGEDLYVRASKADAVNVMTIHKAKGLEFEAVVLPFLEMNIKVDPVAMRFDGSRPVLRRLQKKYRDFSKNLDAAYREEYLKSFIDELNCVYVALTRAAEELYVFLPQNKKKSSWLAAQLFCCDGVVEKGEVNEHPKEKSAQKDVSALDLPASRYVDWISYLAQFLKGEFSEKRLLENRKNVLRGEVFHYFLSCIGNLSVTDPKSVVKEALEKTQAKFPGFSDPKDIEETLSRFIEDERFSFIFSCGRAEVYREKEIVDAGGHTKRIDRLIVADDEAIIVDYKTSVEINAADREQVKEYVSLVAKIYPEKKVKGCLVYLDALTLEHVL